MQLSGVVVMLLWSCIATLLAAVPVLAQAAAATPPADAQHVTANEHAGHDGHDDHAGHVPATIETGARAAAAIADVRVQDQDGHSRHFHRDLVAGRLVAINFVFTRCTTVCPLLGARFAQVQKLLGDDASRVALISVSIDPANDTPARLAEWSRALGAAPGWTLVTGLRADIDTLARSLGASAADPAAHAPLVLLVDERGAARPWQRLDGLADPAILVAALRAALAAGPAG